MKKKQIIMLVLIALCGVAQAALVTFENGNFGVAASDNMAITTEYLAGAGVEFHTGAKGATNYGSFTGTAYLEQVGQQVGEVGTSGNSGFSYMVDGDGTLIDTVKATDGGMDGLTAAARSAAMGSYFLRAAARSLESLTVQYSTAVSAASFEIWDLDGDNTTYERWKITTYNGNWATPVFSVQTPADVFGTVDTTSYDGQVYNVVLSGGTFDRFVLEYNGTKTPTAGLAFNNFNTTTIPEPASIGMIALGGFLIAGYRRMRKGYGHIS